MEAYLILPFLLLINILSRAGMERNSESRYLSLGDVSLAQVIRYQDIWSLVLGSRRLAADLAFIQTVIYYGSPDPAVGKKRDCGPECHQEHIHIHFHPHMNIKNYALRVLRIDPHFHFSHLFWSAALAWVQERPEEAIDILKEAAGYRPDYWTYSLYMAAMTLRRDKKEEEVMPLLDRMVRMKGCPDIVKNHYALLCEKYGLRERAAQIWTQLLNSAELMYRERAARRLEDIKRDRVKVLTFPD